MSTKTVYQKIPLKKIDMGNMAFSLSPISDVQVPVQLRESISSYGIIHPPLLLGKDKLYIIVTGRRRLIAASEILGQDFCNCLVLPPETTPALALALALEEILTARKPSPVEEAKCWQKAVEFLGEKAREEFGPKLEIAGKLSPAKLSTLLDLENEILDALHTGEISLKLVSRLMDIDRKAREVLFMIISKLRLSHSNQRKLIEQTRELQQRYDRPITEILSSVECREIVEHPEANPPQRATMLMNWLNSLCHPRLTKAENAHRNFISKLDLPATVTIAHSPSFEKDPLKMTIEFKNKEEIQIIWPELKRVLSRS
jgi:hypothetical protein